MGYFVHVYMRADGLCGTATCDSEYPPRVAFSLLTKTLEDFDAAVPSWKAEKRNEAIVWPALETMLAKYQDPASADQIMKIQKKLAHTEEARATQHSFPQRAGSAPQRAEAHEY